MKFLIEINDDEIKEQILEEGEVEEEDEITDYDIIAWVSSLIGVYHSDYEVEILNDN